MNPFSEAIHNLIGTLELNAAALTMPGDDVLEQSTTTSFAAPSAQPPYCEMHTAMITTCAGDNVLETVSVQALSSPSSAPMECHATYFSSCNSVL
jgi:hypothetical protein